MADILVQFHALPEEVTAFAKQCMEDFNLHAVAIKYFPYEIVEVCADDMGKLSEITPAFRELALTIKKPILSIKDNFKENNPSRLQIGLEKIGEEGLRQIALSARTDDVVALSVWNKIARRLKGITHTGVIALNPDTGATCPAKTFRYSSGAKAVALGGVPMLPVGGGNVLKFTENR